MVRDPVEKYISRFCYNRHGKFKEGLDSNLNEIPPTVTEEEFKAKNLDSCIENRDVECTFFLGQAYDLTVPYFCGQDDECQILGSYMALNMAKDNVDRAYPVVAIIEDLPTSLKVMEALLPDFFKGIEDVYQVDLDTPHTNTNGKKQKVTKENRQRLATNLTVEIEFYEFAKQRLYRQYNALFSPPDV